MIKETAGEGKKVNMGTDLYSITEPSTHLSTVCGGSESRECTTDLFFHEIFMSSRLVQKRCSTTDHSHDYFHYRVIRKLFFLANTSVYAHHEPVKAAFEKAAKRSR